MKKTKAKKKTKTTSSKKKSKPAKKTKVATKSVKKTVMKAIINITPLKAMPAIKKEVKKMATTFDEALLDGEFKEEVPTTAVADPFHADDFDTSRKEIEEGYLDDEEEEDDSEDDDDPYASDETSSFESFDDDKFDRDDEDEYGPSAFANPLAPKKKKRKEFDEEE